MRHGMKKKMATVQLPGTIRLWIPPVMHLIIRPQTFLRQFSFAAAFLFTLLTARFEKVYVYGSFCKSDDIGVNRRLPQSPFYEA